jgi:hypothetical protein
VVLHHVRFGRKCIVAIYALDSFSRLVLAFVVAIHPAFGRKCIVAICAFGFFGRLVLAFVVARHPTFGRKCIVAICALVSVSFAPLEFCMLVLGSFVCVC